MAQNDVNIRINVEATQAEQQTVNVRKRMRELMDTMTQLQLQGKEGTEAYASAANELGKLKDAMGDTAAQARILSDDFFKQRAAMEGLSVGLNIFSGLSQAAALCGIENEDLQKTLVKLQAAQNLANTAMNIAKALNKDTALMTALRTAETNALTGAQTKNTAATVAGSAATTSFATAEGVATTGAVTLTGAVKAVGTAIKSIPVVGWVLAAVAAIATLITLIYQANQAEEDGNEARERHLRQLRDMVELQSRLNSTTSLMIMDLSEYEKILSDINNKGTKEWEEAVATVAKQTGLSAKYIESQSGNISNIINDYSELTAETERYNSYLQQQQSLLNERDEKEKKGEELTQEYFDRIKVISDKILESKNKITALQRKYNGYLAVDKKYNEGIKKAVTEVTEAIEDEEAEQDAMNASVDKYINAFKTVQKYKDAHKDEPPLQVVSPDEIENLNHVQQKLNEINGQSIANAEGTTKALDDELEKIRRNKEERLNALQATADFAASVSDVMNALMEDELSKVEGNQRKEQQIRKKYAQKQFALEINRIALDTASAIMGTWAGYSEMGPFGIAAAAIQTAVIAALGVTQTIKAKTALSNALAGKAARGAFITGKSHEQGGELWELEGGEAVLNKKAMSIPSFRALASAMNEATGGVSFNSSFNGNSTSTVLKADIPEDTVRMIVTDTVSAITAIPVVVSESSITSAQRNVRVLQTRATF